MAILRPLTLAALLTGALLGSTPAAASGCTGTANTAGVCTADRVVYEDCVYVVSGQCTQVTVSAPVCVYGWIGDTGYYETVWC